MEDTGKPGNGGGSSPAQGAGEVNFPSGAATVAGCLLEGAASRGQQFVERIGPLDLQHRGPLLAAGLMQPQGLAMLARDCLAPIGRSRSASLGKGSFVRRGASGRAR